MAVDHLEGFLKYKTLIFNRSDAVQGLNYDVINMQPSDRRKKDFADIMNNGFDSYSDRNELALDQLYIIGHYLNDFQKIKESVMGTGTPATQATTQQVAIKKAAGQKAAGTA